MKKTFNTNGICYPDEHYMVDLESRLKQIKELVDDGKYFVINRARQYGKTTTLRALANYLQSQYIVLSLDFQRISSESFQDEYRFSEAFIRSVLKNIHNKKSGITGLDVKVISAMEKVLLEKEAVDLSKMFDYISDLCETAKQPIVLMIDEADSASGNQVFLDFLSQLRALYLSRKEYPAFQSVILAGIYDIKNLKQKIRPDEEHIYNSPWNIAADFNIDMSFSVKDIEEMLREYETDRNTGMNIEEISKLIYEYTSGYPFLVSRICQLIDEMAAHEREENAWTKKGLLKAVKILLLASSTLFDDMTKKLSDFSALKNMLKEMLFLGREYSYETENSLIRLGSMFGFLKNQNNIVMVANRIFETKLYNIFLSEEETENLKGVKAVDKNQFVQNGRLNMEKVLGKFAEYFEEIYGDCKDSFLEENGRRLFLLYLRPIINGTGNYYIEARTRNMKRTDIIVDYLGEQFVIELKIWHGTEYQERGKRQLFEYLQFYHQNKGYLLSFNFNKKKETGIKKIEFQGKEIVEVVV